MAAIETDVAELDTEESIIAKMIAFRTNSSPSTGKNFIESVTSDVGIPFFISYIILGSIAVCLNIVIFGMILFHYRTTIKQVFYMLVLNFVVTDCVKGCCLIVWSARLVAPDGQAGILSKLDQNSILIARFCSMTTILNIFIITMNEFLFIRFPLRYNRFVTTNTAVVAIVGSWVCAGLFVLMESLMRSHATRPTVLVLKDQFKDSDANSTRPTVIRKHEQMSAANIFNFVLLAFCFLCLFLILASYISFYRVVRKIQNYDERIRKESQPRLDEFANNSENLRRHSRVVSSRYKYTLVIGLVILIYSLYLVSYAILQVWKYYLDDMSPPNSGGSGIILGVNANRDVRSSLILQWTLRLIIGIHAVLQPLCYFRIREFRRLLKRSLMDVRNCIYGNGRVRYGSHERRSSTLIEFSTQVGLRANDPRNSVESNELLDRSLGPPVSYSKIKENHL